MLPKGGMKLALAAMAAVDRTVLSDVADALTRTWDLTVGTRIPALLLPPSGACWRQAGGERQFLAGEAIRLLRQLPIDPDSYVLGLLSCDITVPIMQYVLGEAEMGGRCAVISTARLGDERVPERAAKLAVHEVGHLFDLAHCHNADCAMFPVSCLDELDARRTTLCRYCLSDWGYRR